MHLIFDFFALFSLFALIFQDTCYNFFHFLFNVWHIFFTEQIRNLTDSQNGIDIFHKRLLWDLIVWEHENCWSIVFEGYFLVPFFYFLSELFELESLGNSYLTEVKFSYESC